MPDYLDHLFLFGRQIDQNEIGFSSFREQMSLRGNRASHCNDPLGRSGKQYQLCYNLKGVTCTRDDPEDPNGKEFSIRQAAVYHRFDVVSGNTVWIVTKGRTDLYERFKELTGKNARPEDRAFQTPEECLRSSLSAHLLFCHWATEEWRAYIKWLEEIIQQQVRCSFLPACRYMQEFFQLPCQPSTLIVQEPWRSDYLLADQTRCHRPYRQGFLSPSVHGRRHSEPLAMGRALERDSDGAFLQH